MRIRLLGAPKITRLDHNVNIQRRKGIALLAYLAVTAQYHTRDALSALFWPEYPQSSARANLRRDLSRLKSELGEQILLIENEKIGLDPQIDLRLDVTEFQSIVNQPSIHGHSLHSSEFPLCVNCHSALTHAVELYQSDFMSGFSLPDCPLFDEWQFFQSEGLNMKLAEALQYLIHWHVERHEHGDAMPYSRRWVSMDRLHEPAQRNLIQLYAKDGQYSAALRQYQEFAKLLKEELKVDPEPETIQLYESIRHKKLPLYSKQTPRDERRGKDYREKELAPASSSKPKHNLPALRTHFLGRTSELHKINTLLFENPSCRLVTLLGPGGSGKTRLALESGIQAFEHTDPSFSGGVWFVQLAPLTEPGSILSAIAQSINPSMHLEQDNPRRRLLDFLRRENLLIILDNFEHLDNAESAAILTDILNAAPLVKIMVTSRTRLNVQGEYILPISGLSFPAPEDLLADLVQEGQTDFSAIELFRQSARRVRSNFKIDENNYIDVIKICRQVEGMPLAIELAASWLGILSVKEIAAEVEHNLDFLETEWHDLPQRQRSLRAVFNASWNLLSVKEQEIVKSLSIFRADFSREAAGAISTASLKILLELMNKSWLQRRAEDRYGLHELLRQYAYEKLLEEPDILQNVQKKYCSYYVQLTKSVWEKMQGLHQGEAYAEIEQEFDNLQVAWRLLIFSGHMEQALDGLLPAIFLYSEVHSKNIELLQMVVSALRILPKPGTVMGVLDTIRAAFLKNGFPIRLETFGMVLPANTEAIQRSWQLIGSRKLPSSLGFWGIISAYIYGRTIDLDAGIGRLDEILLEMRREGRLWENAFGALHQAMLILTDHTAKPEQSKVDSYLSEAWQVFQGLGDRIHSGHVLRQRGNLHYLQGKFQEAIEYWQLAQDQLQAGGEQTVTADIHWQIGDAHLQLGRFSEAFHSYELIFEAYMKMGYLHWAAAVKSKESYEALRYSDIEHAWRTRNHSLALAREVGDKFVEAWGTWEMGEIWRVSGNFIEARRCYENSRIMFSRLYDATALTFYHRSIGDISLAEANYTTALNQFKLSMESALATNHNWALAYALAGLGKAETYLGQFEHASPHFLEAIRLAKKTGDKGIAFMVLAGYAELLIYADQKELALRLALLVINHSSSWRETREQASALFTKISSNLPPEDLSALRREVQTLEVWDVIDRIIARPLLIFRS